MDIEHSEMMWLDEQHEVTLAELVALSGMTQIELELLVECGALVPINPEPNTKAEAWFFSGHTIVDIGALSRLKQAFELEQNSLGLMLVFLGRIRILEHQLNRR